MTQNKTSEKGNIFVLILLGVFLFAALMYSFTRSANQGSGNLTKQQAKIAAQEIISYARLVEGAVNRVRQNGCSENDISFDNAIVNGYSNPNSPTDNSCHIFEEDGGRVVYATLPTNYIDSSFSTYQSDLDTTWGEWIYSGSGSIPEIGTDCSTSDCKELTANIHFLDREICLEVNNLMKVTNPSDSPPPENSSSPPGTWEVRKYIGTYDNTANFINNNSLDKTHTACLMVNDGTNDYYSFYHVLFAR